MSAARFALFALGLASASCLAALEPPPPPDASPIAVGASRAIELRYLRFDVVNYEKTLTRADILALPESVRSRLWLLDLDLRNGAYSPRLLDNALTAIRGADPATLSAPARNLQRLLAMTPDTANLQRTSLEQLLGLAPLLGIAPAQVLADMLGVAVDREFIGPTLLSQVILEQVIGTHPNARTRPGPRDAAHPDGRYPVAPGSIPVTLEDAASDFSTLSRRFGPALVDGVYHPGFLTGEVRARVLTDRFRMTVRANANALPYNGVDLTSVTDAAVNPVASQIRTLFDFSDPNWLVIEGLAPGVARIDAMTFHVTEWDGFVPGGRSPTPRAHGDSPAWALPPWTLESVLVVAGQRSFARSNATLAYRAPGRGDPLFTGTVTDGWVELAVQGGLGSPPPPSYLWDVLLEVAQVRLHDGGIAEGDADVDIALRDVPTGLDGPTLEGLIRRNLQADPALLSDVAARLIDNSVGAADFFYVRPRGSTGAGDDWLFFVTDDDIRRGADGRPERRYAYANPGFFRDPALTQRLSTRQDLDGDTAHEKVRLATGMRLYTGDDAGRVYRVDVGAKSALSHRSLTVTRVR